jgi:LPS-assembly lipoprotein
MRHGLINRRVGLGLVATLSAVALGGCLRPLYGSAEFGGLAVQERLAGVEVVIQGERLAHYIRNELEFALRGGDPKETPIRYRLVVNARTTTNTAIIDRVAGVAETATLALDANYTLMAITGAKIATDGNARVLVSYDRSQQRFATIRAARDAEIQGARQLSDQIRTRIAAFLAANR